MGACGDATISFEASPTLLAYLRDGTPQGFVAIDATLVSGSVVNMPTYMYTGDGATNKGWVLEASACTPSCAMDKTFASSYAFNAHWNYCNSAPNTGGERVYFSYDAPPAPPSPPSP